MRKGRGLHPKTGCLTDALLRQSGFDVPPMIDLNKRVQMLRQGMRDAAAGPQEPGRGA